MRSWRPSESASVSRELLVKGDSRALSGGRGGGGLGEVEVVLRQKKLFEHMLQRSVSGIREGQRKCGLRLEAALTVRRAHI